MLKIRQKHLAAALPASRTLDVSANALGPEDAQLLGQALAVRAESSRRGRPRLRGVRRVFIRWHQ